MGILAEGGVPPGAGFELSAAHSQLTLCLLLVVQDINSKLLLQVHTCSCVPHNAGRGHTLPNFKSQISSSVRSVTSTNFLDRDVLSQ